MMVRLMNVTRTCNDENRERETMKDRRKERKKKSQQQKHAPNGPYGTCKVVISKMCVSSIDD
jgi:hypothetical protein